MQVITAKKKKEPFNATIKAGAKGRKKKERKKETHNTTCNRTIYAVYHAPLI